ncbi:hypothetical protein B8X00_12175 [Acetobacter fabarum]|uniref:Uncharacterized protein n=1 Tax=Acetobacter fabarum TaxID=483199 RepID=A0A269XUP4_9PROT|nr:hypothetical protein B8X00_12175 [Acetobacter fabarum]
MIHTPINARKMESQSRPQYQRVFRTLQITVGQCAQPLAQFHNHAVLVYGTLLGQLAQALLFGGTFLCDFLQVKLLDQRAAEGG